MTEPLVRIRSVEKHFPIGGGFLRRPQGCIRAVDGVTLDVRRGETVGLVGESGSGKTTLGRVILRLIEPSKGSVHFDGVDVLELGRTQLRALRRRMQIVFQDPHGSLNPRMTVGSTLREPLTIHGLARRAAVDERVAALLTEVGMDPSYARSHPHELSGGQRQRVGIARALSVEPEFLVLDEPVSALDVSVRAQIMNLLLDLQHKRRLTYLLIAHDLAVVQRMADRVAVMYLGHLVELASTEDLYTEPLHPYTRALLSAIPVPDPDASRERIVLRGELPSPKNPPSGCPFRTRCFHPKKDDQCTREQPALREVRPNHWAACHYAEGAWSSPDGG